MTDLTEKITSDVKNVITEIIEKAKMKENSVFVLGGSSSETVGEKLGTASNRESAEAVISTVLNELKAQGVYLAVQCCEHLNRALVVERAVAERLDLEVVNVIPQPHAGGAFAVAAYKLFENPVMVESLNAKADAGMDIGGVMIGMHIHPVVVPLRLENRKVGEAFVLAARRRPKYVGGERAVYDEALM